MSLLKSLKLREFGAEESRSSSSSSSVAVANVLAPRIQEPKMSSQFPAFQEEDEEDEEDEHIKDILQKMAFATEEKAKMAKVL